MEYLCLQNYAFIHVNQIKNCRNLGIQLQMLQPKIKVCGYEQKSVEMMSQGKIIEPRFHKQKLQKTK